MADTTPSLLYILASKVDEESDSSDYECSNQEDSDSCTEKEMYTEVESADTNIIYYDEN